MSEPPSMRPGPFVPQENHEFPLGEKKVGAEGLPAVNQELAISVDEVAHGVIIDNVNFTDLALEPDIDAFSLFSDSPAIEDSNSEAVLSEVEAKAMRIDNIAVGMGIEVVDREGTVNRSSSFYMQVTTIPLIDRLFLQKSDIKYLETKINILLGGKSLDLRNVLDNYEQYKSNPDLRIVDIERREIHASSELKPEEQMQHRERYGEHIKVIVHDKESWQNIVQKFGIVVASLTQEEHKKEQTSIEPASAAHAKGQATVVVQDERKERAERSRGRREIPSIRTRNKHEIGQGILSDVRREEARKKEREKQDAEKERDIERVEIKKHERQESIVKEEVDRSEKRKGRRVHD